MSTSKKPHALYIKHGPKFYNKDGTLNKYGLSCGYIEQFFLKEKDYSNYITLELDCIYHIRGKIDDVIVWETTASLTEARKMFRYFKHRMNT